MVSVAVAAGAGMVVVAAVGWANATVATAQSSIAIKRNFFICFTPFCIILLSGISAGILADIWKDWFTPNERNITTDFAGCQEQTCSQGDGKRLVIALITYSLP
jgi:hypothetical protein